MIVGLAQHLKEKYGITINNMDYYDAAFTHKSYVNEHPHEKLDFYERTEFLGDAVMQLCVSEYLFKKYPEKREGELSKLRAAMVCEDSFSKFAIECRFDEFIRLGKGEEKNNARRRPSLLCDIFEAFIGALYLDQGKTAVEAFISQVIFPKIEMGWFDPSFDHKAALQEYLQQNGQCELEYQEVWSKGPDNDRTYKMKALNNGDEIGEGMGHSKKAAEQAAALDALKKLQMEG